MTKTRRTNRPFRSTEVRERWIQVLRGTIKPTNVPITWDEMCELLGYHTKTGLRRRLLNDKADNKLCAFGNRSTTETFTEDELLTIASLLSGEARDYYSRERKESDTPEGSHNEEPAPVPSIDHTNAVRLQELDESALVRLVTKAGMHQHLYRTNEGIFLQAAGQGELQRTVSPEVSSLVSRKEISREVSAVALNSTAAIEIMNRLPSMLMLPSAYLDWALRAARLHLAEYLVSQAMRDRSALANTIAQRARYNANTKEDRGSIPVSQLRALLESQLSKTIDYAQLLVLHRSGVMDNMVAFSGNYNWAESRGEGVLPFYDREMVMQSIERIASHARSVLHANPRVRGLHTTLHVAIMAQFDAQRLLRLINTGLVPLRKELKDALSDGNHNRAALEYAWTNADMEELLGFLSDCMDRIQNKEPMLPESQQQLAAVGDHLQILPPQNGQHRKGHDARAADGRVARTA